MSEVRVINHTRGAPATVRSLHNDLRRLGVRKGGVLLVHSSLSSLGWVCGGPVAVIQALEGALGREGTLVMPTHTSQLSDPATWRNPPVPTDWIDTIRRTMPAFDPLVTPTRGMGAIPECFRSQPGVLRSNHPHDSFAARGPEARRITCSHGLHDGLGEGSPLARLYELDASVLLLGVGHDSNTSLHLAEYRANYAGRRWVENGGPVTIGNRRCWARVRHLDYSIADFMRLGHAFAAETGESHSGRVGAAASMLFPQRRIVDYAVDWFERYR